MESYAQLLAHQEAVHREAQRIASLSAVKLLRSRTQRGGMRLHRSLQLSMVMRSARDLMVSSVPVPKPVSPPPRESRKRRSCGSGITELVPSKRACLWQETPEPQEQGGAFPGLAEVLQRVLRTVRSRVPPGGCRGPGAVTPVHNRAVEAF